jgi:RHS repeat-associated protein
VLNRKVSESGIMGATTGACPGATTLAGLTYDPLGRRSVLTFGDGSTQTYGYDNADRLLTLAHAFPSDAPDNVTLTYGYDAGGRELTRQYSNPAYAWSATAGTTGYSAANALNQYQPSGAFTWQWWPEGPQKEDPAAQENYDEQGQLTLAYVTTTPGTIDPNNWWQAQTDALGHRLYHERQTAAGVAYPLIDESTDGLRPETILDTQYSVLSGVRTLQGYRRYVLGPDPDEFLAWIDLDNTIRYPHTDRQGTAIAQSAAGAVVQKWTYDVYGQSAGAISDIGPGATTYPFRYTGQRLDPSTGFYNYKARDYAPTLGRFLQPDPAGVDQGPNLYEYVTDDPVDRTDPTGDYQRGTGFSDSDWKKFDKLQQSAAKSMTAEAGRLEKRAEKLDAKGKRGGDRLRVAAKNLNAGAAALKDTGKDAATANLVADKDWSSVEPTASPDAQARTHMNEKRTNFRNSDNGVFGHGDGTGRWTVGHESIHTATHLPDQQGKNGALGYRYGSDAQRQAYRELQNTDTGSNNPDNLMGMAIP